MHRQRCLSGSWEKNNEDVQDKNDGGEDKPAADP